MGRAHRRFRKKIREIEDRRRTLQTQKVRQRLSTGHRSPAANGWESLPQDTAAPRIDYAQVADEVCDDDVRSAPQQAIFETTDATLRSDSRLKHLLALRKGMRKQLLESGDERRKLNLLRKAEEKVHQLARKNRRLSIQHCKGERRKTHRPGVGKSGSCSWWSLAPEDVDAAREHACASAQESNWDCEAASQPIDIYALLGVPIASCESTPWEEAMGRAEVAAAKFCSQHTRASLLPLELQFLMDTLEKTGSEFDKFRAKFLRRHGGALLHSLNQCTEGRSLTPAPLAPEVQERFLATCGKRMAKISPGFHGTATSTHDSIFQKGLLIPGQDNGLRVMNGSAHGNGVYVAKLSNPWLSQSFARGANKMLICGVVDDALALTQEQRLGSFQLCKESSNVRHVGDAMVVFESVRVAPLFVAEWQHAKSVAHRSLQNPSQKKKFSKRNLHTARRSCVSHDGRQVRDNWAWEATKHRRGRWFEQHFDQHFYARTALGHRHRLHRCERFQNIEQHPWQLFLWRLA